MGKRIPDRATDPQVGELLALADQLESKLELLDRVGAHIAAAHLDTAIARIRADARSA